MDRRIDMIGALAGLGLTSKEFEDAERQVSAVYARIPPDKFAVYMGAERVAQAANDMDARTDDEDSDDDEGGIRRNAYRNAGLADRLLSAVDSFAASFCGGDGLKEERMAVEIVQRISDWFAKNGLGGLKEPLAIRLQRAKELHNAGLALHKAEAEAAKSSRR